jgi:hypothetical protein
MMVVSMNDKELSRLDVLLDLEAGRITIREAGERMGLRHRQVFRLVKAFRQRGAASLVSCRRGRPSNNRLPAAVRDLAMAIVKERYADFGPTLAAEKLAEVHGCRVSRETLRKWMMEDCGYARGLRSIQRYWTRTYPAPSVQPGGPHSNGCGPSSRRRSARMYCAARSAISPICRSCFTASTTGACPTATGPWSFSRTTMG